MHLYIMTVVHCHHAILGEVVNTLVVYTTTLQMFGHIVTRGHVC